jgi:hypothetical protein
MKFNQRSASLKQLDEVVDWRHFCPSTRKYPYVPGSPSKHPGSLFGRQQAKQESTRCNCYPDPVSWASMQDVHVHVSPLGFTLWLNAANQMCCKGLTNRDQVVSAFDICDN